MIRAICRDSSRPIFFQVFPASVERYMPSPDEVITPRGACSPMPTYTTFGSDSATAMAPTDPVFMNPSEMFRQVIPMLSDFHTPPPVVPM
jgi:hypothetical protein